MVHYSTPTGLALLCLVPLIPVVTDASPRIIALPLLAGLVLLLIGAYRHMGHLCAQCVKTMPLDPGLIADRRRWMLRLVHRFPDLRKWSALAPLLLFAALVVAATVYISLAVLSLAHTAAAVLWVAIETHFRYQPWCPWCRHGGGGGGDDTPTPEPGPREDHVLTH